MATKIQATHKRTIENTFCKAAAIDMLTLSNPNVQYEVKTINRKPHLVITVTAEDENELAMLMFNSGSTFSEQAAYYETNLKK